MVFQKVVDMIFVIRSCIDRFRAKQIVPHKDTDHFFLISTWGDRANTSSFRGREFLS